MPMRSRFALFVFLLGLAPGCDYYARPYRPLPETFMVKTLEGALLNVESLRGKPWVINLWMPG
jgi:hypothetical protein